MLAWFDLFPCGLLSGIYFILNSVFSVLRIFYESRICYNFIKTNLKMQCPLKITQGYQQWCQSTECIRYRMTLLVVCSNLALVSK